jgi:glycolate oxidase iron-sulfur subunit
MNTSIKPLVAATSPHPIAERMKLTLNYDELTNCMRCGFCQPACPTFKETGVEAASPRGRIALMKAVTDGLMAPDEAFREQMDLCLGCRACEPVCPADVKYGQLLEQTRDALEVNQEHHRWWVKLARKVSFTYMFPSQKRMQLLGGSLRLYQRSGLSSLARKSVLKLFPEPMRQMEAILPDASSKGVVEQLGTFYPAKGKAIAKVGLFRGCIMDVLFTETNVNTVKLLAEAGFDIVIPDTQNCCGALHAHSGEFDQAKALAKKNIQAFQGAGVDYIISNAGGCGALLVEYDHLLHDDEEWKASSKWFASRVKDVAQVIMEKGNVIGLTQAQGAGAVKAGELSQDAGAVKVGELRRDAGAVKVAELSQDAGAVKAGEYQGYDKMTGTDEHEARAASAAITVTYQDSCHLRNVMRAGNAPRDLISRVANATFVELKDADRCCGSAGIYNLVKPDMSMQILDHKMEHVKQTEAHVLLTSNPGCLLQMKLGVERENMSGQMKVLHLVDFLYERMVANQKE